jgi:hypothetical protein
MAGSCHLQNMKGLKMARVIYKNENKKQVPSVTTILNILSKPALYRWHNIKGLEGVDTSIYVDELALIGTLSHYRVECYLTNQKPDFAQFNATQEQIDKSEECANKFFEWENCQAEFVPIASELQLVSEKHQFGGTCDCIAVLNGKLTLIDFKTCNAIYDEARQQVAAYKEQINENFGVIEPKLKELGYDFKEIQEVVILRIGRSAEESFDYVPVPKNVLDIGFEIFLDCLSIYNKRKQFNKAMKEV